MNKTAKAVVLMGMLLLVSVCATGMVMNNTIRRVAVDYTNRSENDVYDFMIEFGKYKIPSADKDDVFVNGGGGTFINQMPLPETMTVQWREKSGVVHNEVVEISRHAPSQKEYNDLLSFVVNIYDGNLEVFLEVKKIKKWASIILNMTRFRFGKSSLANKGDGVH